MRRVIIGVFVLLMISGVFAMSEPIRVKANEGEEVKIYVWPGEGGRLLNMKNGIVGEEGFFETTFFALNVENYKLQIMVLDSGKNKVRDSDFLNMGTEYPVFIDCLSSECVTYVLEVKENVSVVDQEELGEDNAPVSFTGKVVDAGEGFEYWSYIIITVVCFSFIFFIVSMMRRGRPGIRGSVVGEGGSELQAIEKRLEATEAKINKIKNERAKGVRIEEIKAKLTKDEKELRELEGDKGSGK
jgi:hypothetical protein